MDSCSALVVVEQQASIEAGLNLLSISEGTSHQQHVEVLDLQRPIDRMDDHLTNLVDHLAAQDRFSFLEW